MNRYSLSDLVINYGAIFENVVAQELAAQGHSLYYFNSKKQGEVDFIIEDEGRVMPIEVKLGKDYERHNALTNLLNNNSYNIDEAIILQNNNLRADGKKLYAPIYMCAFITPHEPKSLIFKPDLTNLI